MALWRESSERRPASPSPSDAYFAVAGDALQLFGGVGFTWEYDVHLYFKRAKSSEHLLGNGVFHRERLARMLLDKGEES